MAEIKKADTYSQKYEEEREVREKLERDMTRYEQ